MKSRKIDLALIAIHAKLEIVNSRGSENLSPLMKSMAKMTFNIYSFKSVNLPSRIKGIVGNRQINRWLWLWW